MSRIPVHPIVVSVSHAAELLDCSRPHIYSLIRRGELRRIQVAGSRAVRVPVVDIYGVLGLDVPPSTVPILAGSRDAEAS